MRVRVGGEGPGNTAYSTSTWFGASKDGTVMEQQQHAHGDIGYGTPLTERLRELSRGRPVRRLTRLMIRPLGFSGLAVALIFFWMSLTPSLVPRAWLFQGVVSGLAAVVGYGIGSAISALMRRLRALTRSRRSRTSGGSCSLVAAVLGSSMLLWQAHGWQNELRALVGLDDVSAFRGLGVLLITATTAGVVLVGARLVRALARWLIHEVDRIAPAAGRDRCRGAVRRRRGRRTVPGRRMVGHGRRAEPDRVDHEWDDHPRHRTTGHVPNAPAARTRLSRGILARPPGARLCRSGADRARP